MASDGVWDVLENSEVIGIVEKFYTDSNAEGASQALVNEARRIWKKKYTQIDDITASVIFLISLSIKCQHHKIKLLGHVYTRSDFARQQSGMFL